MSSPAKDENDRSTPNVVGLRLSTANPLTKDAEKGKRAQTPRLSSGHHTVYAGLRQRGISAPPRRGVGPLTDLLRHG